MPTTRPRHVITETEPVAAALDDAAERWPKDRGSRARLLVRLVQEGHRAIIGTAEQERSSRVAAVRSTSGTLTGSYGPDYLGSIREEWPE